MLKMLLPGITMCTLIAACSSAPPKEPPCIGLVVKGKTVDYESRAQSHAAVEAHAKNGKDASGESGEALHDTVTSAAGTDNAETTLSKSDQLKLLEVSGALNALRKEVFTILDRVSSIDISRTPKHERESIEEVAGALAETRHYLDHEAELIYTIPYIRREYFHDMARNRIDGIVKTSEIIHLYKTNIESLFQKMGKSADLFSPEETLKLFESSIAQLDRAKDILQPYVDQ